MITKLGSACCLIVKISASYRLGCFESPCDSRKPCAAGACGFIDEKVEWTLCKCSSHVYVLECWPVCITVN